MRRGEAIEDILVQKTLDSTINSACGAIRDAANASTVAFYLWDTNLSTLTKQTETKAGGLSLLDRIQIDSHDRLASSVSQAVEERKTWFREYQKRTAPGSPFTASVTWDMAIPVTVADSLYGVFVAGSPNRKLLKRGVGTCDHIGRVVSIRVAQYLEEAFSSYPGKEVLSACTMVEGRIPDYSLFYPSCFAELSRLEPQAACACIWLLAAETQEYRKLVLRAISDQSLLPPSDWQKVPITDTGVTKVIEANALQYWNSVQDIADFHDPTIKERLGDSQVAAIPIHAPDGKVIGLLTVYFPAATPGVEERIDRIQTLADLIGITLELAAWAEKRKATEALFEATVEFISQYRTFAQIGSQPTFFQRLSCNVRDAIDVGGLSVFFKETEVSQRLHLFASSGVEIPDGWEGRPYLDLFSDTITARVAKSGRTYIEDNVPEKITSEAWREEFPEKMKRADLAKSWLIMPIFSGDSVVGVIRCLGRDCHVQGMLDFFEPVDLEVISLVSQFFKMVSYLHASEEASMFGKNIVGHDMLSILTLVSNASEILFQRNVEKNSKSEYLFGDIQDSLMLMEFLSKVPDVFGYWEPEFRLVRFLGSVLAPVASLLKRYAGKRRIRIYYEENVEKIPRLWLDPRRMQELVYNIIMNSIKYIPDACKDRLISIRYKGVEDEYFVIEFSDQGIGVKEDDTERIFEIGERSEEAKELAFVGQGMGLPAARIIAQKHGGDIRLISKQRPTVFQLLLPKSLQGGAPL